MIGIYGGTFDPIHYGHLRTALEMKEAFALTEMRLIPCAQPPHKTAPHATTTQRLAMLELATQAQPALAIDRRELDQPGLSYMVNTLHALRAERADQPLLLFIGTDAFKTINTWHHWQRLFDYAHLVVMTRPNHQLPPLSKWLQAKLSSSEEALSNSTAGNLLLQSTTQLDISATTIRRLIATGKDPSFLLPDTVISYIKQNKLYGSRDLA